MIYPKFIKPGDTIGVTATSHAIDKEIDQLRFEHGAGVLGWKDYDVYFTKNVFGKGDAFGRSSEKHEKAREFNMLVEAKKVTAIFAASGGNFLEEMLPFIDLEAFKNNPKWVQGYSDNTSLLYYLTTKGDIATAYGANFGDFGMEPWQPCVEKGFKILTGELAEQESFDFYQDGFTDRETGLEGYSADKPVEWKVIQGEGHMKGRMIGGCLDVLEGISETPFDGTLDFIEKYGDDGIIWYLESFALGFETMMTSLWKLKTLGWFDKATGFVFGRPLFYTAEDFAGNPLPTYKEVLLEQLSEFNVPIIMDADIGHKGPQIVTINGAMAEIESKNGRGKVTYSYI